MITEQLNVASGGYSRTVWLHAASGAAAHPLCVFLDGEYYLEKLCALPVLAAAMADGVLPQLSLLFVASNGPQSRHEDYACNDRFARFVADDLVRFARTRVGSIREDRHLVCGLSLSGLASAYVTLTAPHVFSAALSQSGSFWWNRTRFATFARGASRIDSRHWLSVGDAETDADATHAPSGMRQELSQIEGVRSAVEALTERGAEVRHHVYRGGHAFDPWRDELVAALAWLLRD